MNILSLGMGEAQVTGRVCSRFWAWNDFERVRRSDSKAFGDRETAIGGVVINQNDFKFGIGLIKTAF